MRVVNESYIGSNPFVDKPLRPARVAVVDDHELVGKLVVSLIERAGFSAQLVLGDTTAATWSRLMAVDPEFILFDSDLGPGRSATELIEMATAAGVTAAGLTASTDRLEHARLLEAGAGAVVSKGCSPSSLVALVELALDGAELMAVEDRQAALAWLRRHREGQRRRMAIFDRLTTREAETLVLIAAGRGANDIAGEWDVALTTVRSHIRAILMKLGVSSQLQAAAIARDSGWYELAARSSILTMPAVTQNGTIATQSGSRR